MTKPCPDYDSIAPHFRRLERVTFGRSLERARYRVLDSIDERSPPRRLLLLGEGDGRFLARCCTLLPAARMDCLDASAVMLDKARERLATVGDAACGRVRFVQGDIRTIEIPGEGYDLVVTNFFLDCLTHEEIDALVRRVTGVASATAQWWVADFAQPSGVLALRSRAWLGLLYAFFGRVARQPVRRLVDPGPALRASGWRSCGRKLYRLGLLESCCWKRANDAHGRR